MRVAIIGKGAIGLGTAALVVRAGHEAALCARGGDWSPASEIVTSGVIEGRWPVALAASVEEALAGAALVILAVPANMHREVIDALAPQLSTGQVVALWAQGSLSALYLARAAKVKITVALWSGPLIGGRRLGPSEGFVSTLRDSIDVAALPATDLDKVIVCLEAIFGPRFRRGNAVDIVFSNVNPIHHIPQVLCNLPRIERGETWSALGHTTPTVARLIEGLDDERRRVAAAFGGTTRAINEHFSVSFPGIPKITLAEQAPLLAQRLGAAANGPSTLDSRFIEEDVPYGAVPFERVAAIAGVDVPIHRACIDLFNVLLARDMRRENKMLDELGLEQLSRERLSNLLEHGWRD